MQMQPTRRQVLGGLVAAGAGSLLRPHGVFAQDTHARAAGAGAFRFVHMTDIHVQPERRAAQGFAAALRAVEALRPRPDFILTGGDLVFDVMETPADRAEKLFKLYHTIIRDNTSLKVYDTLGNHDVFGWQTKEGVTPRTPGYGKALAKHHLRLERTYYRFDHKGWRFLVLDNIQPGEGTRAYQGYLDKEQREWFAAELKATDPKTPIVICEHIPTLTVTAFWYEDVYKDGAWRMNNNMICGDAADRLRMIRGRNVRLWLSGHIHQRDNIDYRGTTFINDGAVCGSWWKGAYHGVDEGFGVLDLHSDGRVEHRYMTYGWKAEPEPAEAGG